MVETPAAHPVEGQGPHVDFVAGLIRRGSEAGRLLTAEEIGQALAGRGLVAKEPGDPRERVGGIIAETMAACDDLVMAETEGGAARYFSSRFMTESYATLLVRREGDPLRMIAAVVRENSARYPRPVPIALFEAPPFSLGRGEVGALLERMLTRGEYADIRRTTTSIGTVFLYSTLHLEPGYAATLAEWQDVGQANNP